MSLKIVVCIKQVPGTSEVQIDPVTGVLIRDGNNTKMNPYDLYGLETALRIKETNEGTVIKTISMGPPPATAVLKESLWMGVDETLLISDRKFGGADVVATAYTISQGVRSLGEFDLIICGKQTTDGDTAQVGPEMAEYLGIPHVAYVEKIVEIKEHSIVLVTNMDNTLETYEVNFPCLITVDKGHVTPRLPSYRRGRSLKDVTIPVITFKDVEDQDETHYGLKGSPTQVERMFPPFRNTEKIMFEGNDAQMSEKVFEILRNHKHI